MSELNNENKKTFKVKVWVPILIYFIIATSITTGLIIFKNSNKNLSENANINEVFEEVKKKELADVRKITLKDKYALNNLIIEEVNEEIGEQYDYFDYDADGIADEIINRISITYAKIDGLKNSYVEDKINKKILDKVNSLKKEYIIDEHTGKINITVSTYSPGFGNVISIDVSAAAYANTGEEYYSSEELLKSEMGAFNIRLDTGEEITFEEVFTNDADLNFIIAQTAYEHVIKSMKYVDTENDEYSWDFDMDNVDYGLIENDVVRMVNRFKRNLDSLKFSISERYITIYFPDKSKYMDVDYFSIDMYDFVDYIAIYTRFLKNESLYTDGDLEERIYVFRYAIDDEYMAQFEFDEISPNVLVQISSNAGPGYEDIVSQRVEKVKNYLIRQADPSIVYICSFYVDYEDRWEHGSGYIRTMPKTFFEENKDYILRYIDSSTDSYEEPNFDESKLEYEYFDLYFDQNNDVTMVVQGEEYEPEIEGGSDEVLDEEPVVDVYTNSVTNTINTNTITNSVTNTISNNTVEDDIVIDNTIADNIDDSDFVDNTTVYQNTTNTIN